jgi:cysteinyl-tRNA synthetase
LASFNRVFAVIDDNDAEKLQALGYGDSGGGLSDAEVEKMVAQRQDARSRRDYAAADRIRKELADRGIILEDGRDGSVRWKRK